MTIHIVVRIHLPLQFPLKCKAAANKVVTWNKMYRCVNRRKSRWYAYIWRLFGVCKLQAIIETASSKGVFEEFFRTSYMKVPLENLFFEVRAETHVSRRGAPSGWGRSTSWCSRCPRGCKTGWEREGPPRWTPQRSAINSHNNFIFKQLRCILDATDFQILIPNLIHIKEDIKWTQINLPKSIINSS